MFHPASCSLFVLFKLLGAIPHSLTRYDLKDDLFSAVSLGHAAPSHVKSSQLYLYIYSPTHHAFPFINTGHNELDF